MFILKAVPTGAYTLVTGGARYEPTSAKVQVEHGRTSRVEFGALRLRTNTHGCSPRFQLIGPTSRDLVPQRLDVGPDGLRDWLFSLVPCREGLISRIRIEDGSGVSQWDTVPGNAILPLGVTDARDPDRLLGGLDGPLSAAVTGGQQLLLYVGKEPPAGGIHQVVLEYEDESVDVARTESR